MKPEAQRIAIAEACGWRGQPVKQAWQHKSGFPKYWRSIPIDNSEAFDFFSASRVSRVLLNPQNKPVFRKVCCGVLNNRDSYSMIPIIQHFENADQDKPWPVIEQSLEHFVEHLPDYLNDLNAMHEAEKMLSWADEGALTSERIRYLMNLEAVISGPMDRFGYRPNRTRSVPFAKAAQRAEAFLRTLGKWEDAQ